MKTKRLTLIMSIVLAVIMLVTPLLTSCGTATKTASLATTENRHDDAIDRTGAGERHPGSGRHPGLPWNTSITNSAASTAIRFRLTGRTAPTIWPKWARSSRTYMNEGDVLFSTHSSSEMKGPRGWPIMPDSPDLLLSYRQ